MKLTPRTKDVLNEFSKMDGFFEFMEGKKQAVFNQNLSILMEAELDQEFPKKFGPIRLKAMTNLLKLFDQPEVQFKSDRLVINDGVSEFELKSLSIEKFISASNFNFPANGMTLELSEEIVKKIIKIKRSLGHRWLEIMGDGEAVYLRTTNRSDEDVELSMNMKLCSTSRVFSLALLLDELNLICADYTLHLSDRKVLKMCSKTA